MTPPRPSPWRGGRGLSLIVKVFVLWHTFYLFILKDENIAVLFWQKVSLPSKGRAEEGSMRIKVHQLLTMGMITLNQIFNMIKLISIRFFDNT
jgi:hypothetical protein